jgi:hypothetical protein
MANNHSLVNKLEAARRAVNVTRNNTSNTSRWATNAGSQTARRHGEARNIHEHEHDHISAHDAPVRHSHGRQLAS